MTITARGEGARAVGTAERAEKQANRGDLMTWVGRLWWAAVGALLSVAAGWALWYALAWMQFRRASVPADSTAPLDRLMPIFEVAERHEILVRAPPAVTFAAAEAIDLQRAPVIHAIFAGRQLLLAASDTGIAHLGRVVGVPTVALFGPGSALLCGAGEFWRDVPYRSVTVDPFPCRDQRVLFKREISWVRRCGRSVAECPQHLCMPAIGVATVEDAVADLLDERALRATAIRGEPIR